MRLKKLATLCLTVALPSCATTISLAGTVRDRTQNGLFEISVTLAKAGLSVNTLSDGSWAFSKETSSISKHPGTTASEASSVTVQSGHIELHYQGRDILGHLQPMAPLPASRAIKTSARESNATTDTIDTLLFSWNGKVRLREPLTSYQQTGMAIILDTSAKDDSIFTDPRDNQTYRYVKIGAQTWMAQNLNYKADNTTCYANADSNCSKYGRLYSWSSAMALDAGYNTAAWKGSDSAKHQGVCPAGWHVPTASEWSALIALAGDSSRIKLSSTSGWRTNQGTNVFGLTILPAGGLHDVDASGSLGYYTNFWSASESSEERSLFQPFNNADANSSQSTFVKTGMFSLRCIRDEAQTRDDNVFTDPRDNQTYRYVKIGTQTWMAQNLNYKADNTTCYANADSNCSKYGRLYSWSSAMALDAGYNTAAWKGSDSAKHQGVCPAGWHVPTASEWSALIALAGDSSRIKLSSTSGWRTNQGTNVFGLTILPAGGLHDVDASGSLGYYTNFWSASESSEERSLFQPFNNADANSSQSTFVKTGMFSLRCIRDN